MIRGLIDWRRALIAMPLLAIAAAAVYLLIPRGADASTPRAVLVDTPAGAVDKVVHPPIQRIRLAVAELAHGFAIA